MSERQRGQRRQQIIEAAASLFAQRGFRATTREIAEAVGVSKAALFK